MTSRVARLNACVLLLWAGACTQRDLRHSHAVQAIVDGEAVNGGMQQATLLVVDTTLQSRCTGALIAPCVVLTAKHCVQLPGAPAPSAPEQFRIFVTDDLNAVSADDALLVQQVETTPGVYDLENGITPVGEVIGRDVAVLTLQQSLGIAFYDLSRESVFDQLNHDAIAVGFGQTPDNAGNTLKQQRLTTVTNADAGVLTTPASSCLGDSGGPLIDREGKVFAVSSFAQSQCGQGSNGYNRLEPFLHLIDTARARCGVGTAPPALPDIVCDPAFPQRGCPLAHYCVPVDENSCSGRCQPGEVGDIALDSACQEDTDCQSLRCREIDDRGRRCVQPCRLGAGHCAADEWCNTGDTDDCGLCEELTTNQTDLASGEQCQRDAQCQSARCEFFQGLGFCSRACTDDTICGQGFYCRLGVCARGYRHGVGGRCLDDADCDASTQCRDVAGGRHCTRICDESSAPCPLGYRCAGLAEDALCVPEGVTLGGACIDQNDCLSNLCIALSGSGERVCSRYCAADSPCPVGFACQRNADRGEAACIPVPLPKPQGGGGCASSASQPQPGVGWVVLLGLLYGWWRRDALRAGH